MTAAFDLERLDEIHPRRGLGAVDWKRLFYFPLAIAASTLLDSNRSVRDARELS
jgi:hypothetical protein